MNFTNFADFSSKLFWNVAGIISKSEVLARSHYEFSADISRNLGDFYIKFRQLRQISGNQASKQGRPCFIQRLPNQLGIASTHWGFFLSLQQAAPTTSRALKPARASARGNGAGRRRALLHLGLLRAAARGPLQRAAAGLPRPLRCSRK